MPALAAAGEEQTVVVGVKLDALSKELLTWSLVKVAKPGDRVIALHVLGDDEIVDPDGKSSLLSVVRAFDSVLAVYEGFCNLKQVDLKLKICRGSSVRKILVREALSYSANKLILGTSSKQHKIRSSYSAAKYCAKKLSKDCSVLAVHNGKIVFERESLPSVAKINTSQVANEHRTNTLRNLLNQSANESLHQITDDCKGEVHMKLDLMIRSSSDCAICKPDYSSPENGDVKEKIDRPGNDEQYENSMALVEIGPGWPLLRQTVPSPTKRRDSDPSFLKQNAVAQWAMELPNRYLEFTANQNEKQHEDGASELDGENGAIVLVGDDFLSPFQEDDVTTRLPLELDGLHERYSLTCRLFKYRELQSATSNFAPENLIGKGGSSRVYRGCLPDGKELAVKILTQSKDVLSEFVLEIEIITSLCHRNIISLFGFCFEDNKLVLVYDLLSKGSLEANLHCKKFSQSFGWNERYKVALGVAEALHYLHSQSNQPVIHRDVKSSNILLSDDFEPQLSDFGLAQRASSLEQETLSDVVGTFGYLAPEYFMYGKVTDKIDVYAYGVVLLELLSGRKPISNDHPKGQESLVIWAKPMLNGGKVSELLDPNLSSKYNLDKMERMVLAANLCIRRSPRHRPKMSLVLKLMKGDYETVKWARMQVNTTDNSDRLHTPYIQSHLNLALLDVEEDPVSFSSVEQNVTLEDYLRGRWSRSSSLD